jgi:hypothetical protein
MILDEGIAGGILIEPIRGRKILGRESRGRLTCGKIFVLGALRS